MLTSFCQDSSFRNRRSTFQSRGNTKCVTFRGERNPTRPRVRCCPRTNRNDCILMCASNASIHSIPAITRHHLPNRRPSMMAGRSDDDEQAVRVRRSARLGGLLAPSATPHAARAGCPRPAVCRHHAAWLRRENGPSPCPHCTHRQDCFISRR